MLGSKGHSHDVRNALWAYFLPHFIALPSLALHLLIPFVLPIGFPSRSRPLHSYDFIKLYKV